MRTIRTKIYKFDELKTQKAKDKAIEWYKDGNDLSWIWEDIKNDAKQIGLKIISLDDHRPNSGEFMLSANEVAANILRDHGASCETYKTAIRFMNEWQPVFNKYMETEEGEDQLIDIENDFLNDLLEDYRVLYNEDVNYQNSDEGIIEAITSNGYEFKADGTRF